MSRTHFETFGSEPSVGPGVHDCSAYLLLRDLRDEVLKKMKFFQKKRELAAFREASAFAEHCGLPRRLVSPGALPRYITERVTAPSDSSRIG